jgi:hypothetical protein
MYNTNATKHRSSKTRFIGNRILMTHSVNSSKTRMVSNRILMPQSVNSSKTRMVCNMILMLQSMELAGQGSSGIGFRYSTVQTLAR